MNEYIKGIKPYQAASHDIWSCGIKDSAGYLKLDWNEATVPPSPRVRERILELASAPCFFQWYPNTDNQRLLQAIGDYVGVKKGNVQVFPSSDTLHEYIARTYLKDGDKAIMMWPTYDNFRVAAESVGADIVYYEMDNFCFDAEKMGTLVRSSGARLAYLCNPNNPTGEGLETESLDKLIRENHDCIFVVDEAYMEFFGRTMCRQAAETHNLLVSRTFSKAFGLANFRIGYLVASVENIEAVSRIRNAKSISTFAQEAALAALEDLPYMQGYVREVVQARQMFMEGIGGLGRGIRAYPSEANFVLISLGSEVARDRLADFLKEKKIYIRKPCQCDGVRDCVRVTIGTVGQMKYVMRWIKEFVVEHEDCFV